MSASQDLHNLLISRDEVSGARFAASQLLRVFDISRTRWRDIPPPHEGRTAKLCTRFIRQNWKSIKFCIIMNRSPRPGGPPHRNGCNKRQPGVTTRTNFSLQQPVHLSSSSSFCNYEEKNYENGWGRHKCGLLNVIVIHNKCAWQTIQNTTCNCKMQNAKCKIGMPSIVGGNAP